MPNNMRTLLLALVAVFAVPLGLTACNTTAGIGADIEAAGEAIEDEAKDNKRY